MKSFISAACRAKKSFTRSFTVLQITVVSSRQYSASQARVIVVASATPTMPSFGNGPHPKIKQAFSATFIKTAVPCTIALMFTRSTLRMTARYSVANALST